MCENVKLVFYYRVQFFLSIYHKFFFGKFIESFLKADINKIKLHLTICNQRTNQYRREAEAIENSQLLRKIF